MRNLIPVALAAILLLSSAAEAVSQRVEQVRFPRGATNTVIEGTIEGDEYVMYRVNARDQQFLSLTLDSENRSIGYNLYVPGRGPGDEALDGSNLSGNMDYYGQLYMDGDHTISVFLNRNAARQGQVAHYRLMVEVTDPDSGAGSGDAVVAGSGDAVVAGTDYNATGQLPCARYAGQPMGQCRYGVIREGNGNGRIEVTWPDGGMRVIGFEMGSPSWFDETPSDSGTQMTVDKRGVDLWIVEIGDERFEIPDPIISGG